eukprot:35069-Chlamydomonas_euryale.AAC.4
MRTRVRRYLSSYEFLADVHQIVTNAAAYNDPIHGGTERADCIISIANTLLSDACAAVDRIRGQLDAVEAAVQVQRAGLAR